MPTNFVNNLRLATDGNNGLMTTASLASTIESTAVTVDTDPTLVVAARADRKALIIQNNSSATIYIGPSDVATTTGLALAANSSFSDYVTSAAWYAIVAADTADVRVIEVY